MNSNKKTARIVGVLFLVATVTFMIGSGLIHSVLNSPQYLNNLYSDRITVIVGMFLELINAAALLALPC